MNKSPPEHLEGSLLVFKNYLFSIPFFTKGVVIQSAVNTALSTAAIPAAINAVNPKTPRITMPMIPTIPAGMSHLQEQPEFLTSLTEEIDAIPHNTAAKAIPHKV